MSEYPKNTESPDREQEKASDDSIGNSEEAASEQLPPSHATQVESNEPSSNNNSIFSNHPNPLSSNPVVITEPLASILASENAPPQLPTPPPSPRP
ncbi:hypothetical protein PG993_009572 [Apiospora rasikravindrae]|uniref:Uncharacterized protein n=1 Tax=Apiospora rasikravindrae TaxID=990691 RepID=A0ABR1SJR7_9PEZI